MSIIVRKIANWRKSGGSLYTQNDIVQLINGNLLKVRVRCSAIEMSEKRYQSFRDLTQYQLRETAIIFITGAKREKERKHAKDAEREKKTPKKSVIIIRRKEIEEEFSFTGFFNRACPAILTRENNWKRNLDKHALFLCKI